MGARTEETLAKILESHNLPSNFSYRRACEAGIREVVELIDNTGLIEHNDSPLHEIGATILDCPACCWYAYKKDKWGIEEK